MTIKEQDKPHLWLALQEIKDCPNFPGDEYGFEFVMKNRNIELDDKLTSDITRRRELMPKLEEIGAAKVEASLVREDGYPFWIKILQPKFDEICKDVENKDKENSKETIFLQKQKNKRIQLHKFSPDLKWEEITIQFLNGHEAIITAKDETIQTKYDAMGFQDEKKKLPNKQWQFLKGLSETGGEISWGSSRATPKGKKQKQLLSEALKTYFQIADKPFYDYKIEKAYRIKINLIPESESKSINEQKVFDDEDVLGIKDFYKEHAPEIDDR